jgi:hypothetical protein
MAGIKFKSIEDTMVMTIGNSPIILLSVHGGYIDIPCKGKRPDNNMLIEHNDYNTLELAYSISSELEKKGIIPYMAFNLINREDIDLNRTIENGTNINCKHTIDIYKLFFSNLDKLIKHSKKLYGKCIILDIHGSKLNNTVELGFNVPLDDLVNNYLQNSSIKSLVNIKSIYNGKKSFSYYLEKQLKNVLIFPNSGKLDLELLEPIAYVYYNGANIANRYKDICDYYQIEISQDLRINRFIWTSNKLSEAIYRWITEVYTNL